MITKICKPIPYQKINFMIKFTKTKYTWVKPGGFNTGIHVYNCVAKEKVPLITKQKGIITWYTCGPTVYDDAHIGHATCYLKIDILQRILFKYFNFILVTAMNITDIDDKIIQKSNDLKKSHIEISQLYEKNFWQDLENIKIKKPDVILRVSENIPHIKNYIQVLIDKKFAYKSIDGSVYFKIEDFTNYGKLVKIHKDTDDIKDNKTMDCVVWKASKLNEPFWESSWGNGRPGWHIECSALASKLFGSSVDIHAGGMDLKFPHHENEEAQSCAYHSCSQWVNYWVHIGQLHMKSSEKMSKSLKNTISISCVLNRYHSDVLRFACVMSHYRSRMEYSEELLNMSRKTLEKFRNFLNNCDLYISNNEGSATDEQSIQFLLIDSRKEIHEAFCDDFNTPAVIQILNRIMHTINPLLNGNTVSISTVVSLKKLFNHILNVFNITITEVNVGSEPRESEITNVLIDFRKTIREIALATKDKDILHICDEIRSTLKSKGIDIRDVNKNIQKNR
ncbi:hypothetical protein WA026_003328 [Henosepilachna vigintioctopunctata]|uniref:cysteine--tRNA ligase n=1 Tax=Henosepilachna vigintioctopunctata TaxID=420089 RepID=A0AAW1THC7_9CUCU